MQPRGWRRGRGCSTPATCPRRWCIDAAHTIGVAKAPIVKAALRVTLMRCLRASCCQTQVMRRLAAESETPYMKPETITQLQHPRRLGVPEDAQLASSDSGRDERVRLDRGALAVRFCCWTCAA